MSGFWKPESSFKAQQLKEDIYNEEDFALLNSSPSGMSFAQQRMLLPIYKHKKQIIYSIENYQVVIIVGETGCGKSTQIPQYLLEAGWAGNDFTIICTQPRRLAAITLAQRVSLETGSSIGNRVGYAVRFDEQASPQTKIKYVTDGLLLREATVEDPLLSKYSVVMVDEAHERNLNSDAVLGLLKKIRRKRPELRVIVCSATIDAQSFLDFFLRKNPGTIVQNPSTDSASVINDKHGINEKGTIISVDGRQHPVDILYLTEPASDYLRKTVQTALMIHKYEGDGDILCFLPTGEDIDNAIRLAEEEFHEDIQYIELLPLYGTLPQQLQTRVFQSTNSTNKQGQPVRRRIIFSTNIAETSVTVPNITYVIDSGLVKLPFFDPATAMERLIVTPISQASACQRAGRSGRVRSGKCYRLYTERYLLEQMPAQTPPEILRTNLTSFILTLKSLGVDNILAFDLIDLPSVEALSHGLETLYALGAIDDQTQITKQGLDMAIFPTEPRVARMLLESITEGCSWEVLAVASALQVRDLFQRPRGRVSQQQQLDFQASVTEIADPSGDHVTYVNILSEMEDQQMNEAACRERFLNYLAIRRALEVRDQLASFLRRYGRVQGLGLVGGDGSERSRRIRRCVTAGFFTNVARLDNDGRYRTLRKGIPVTPSSSSILSMDTSIPSHYILFGETIDGARGDIELKSVSSIEARWLRELAPHYWE